MINKRTLREKIPTPATETRRQRIVAELTDHPMTARDLSKTVHISEKEVLSHLEHVQKSLKPPKHLVIIPSMCSNCQFLLRRDADFQARAGVLNAGMKGLHLRFFKS